MKENFNFEKLEVYRRSLDLAKLLSVIAGKFPYKFSRVRDQLVGAVISIPLNIAEGSGRKSIKEKRNFYKISQSSLFECIPLLEIALQLKLINDKDYKKFRKEIVVLSKMISKLIKSTKY